MLRALLHQLLAPMALMECVQNKAVSHLSTTLYNITL